LISNQYNISLVLIIHVRMRVHKKNMMVEISEDNQIEEDAVQRDKQDTKEGQGKGVGCWPAGLPPTPARVETRRDRYVD
jgi:hypothetical protein